MGKQPDPQSLGAGSSSKRADSPNRSCMHIDRTNNGRANSKVTYR